MGGGAGLHRGGAGRVRSQRHPAPAPGGEEELHRWLSLAKLASMSFGEGTLTRERFAWAKELDDARLARE